MINGKTLNGKKHCLVCSGVIERLPYAYGVYGNETREICCKKCSQNWDSIPIEKKQIWLELTLEQRQTILDEIRASTPVREKPTPMPEPRNVPAPD